MFNIFLIIINVIIFVVLPILYFVYLKITDKELLMKRLSILYIFFLIISLLIFLQALGILELLFKGEFQTIWNEKLDDNSRKILSGIGTSVALFFAIFLYFDSDDNGGKK
jgi:hypothetical protein